MLAAARSAVRASHIRAAESVVAHGVGAGAGALPTSVSPAACARQLRRRLGAVSERWCDADGIAGLRRFAWLGVIGSGGRGGGGSWGRAPIATRPFTSSSGARDSSSDGPSSSSPPAHTLHDKIHDKIATAKMKAARFAKVARSAAAPAPGAGGWGGYGATTGGRRGSTGRAWKILLAKSSTRVLNPSVVS
jgi:hypothetical protein